MKITAKLAKEKYDHNKNSETYMLVELEAPKVEWKKDRSPVCIVPVLDVSGSMYGEKIDYLRKACRKLMDHLAPGDFAGLVTYDTGVYQVAPIVEVTQHHKDEMKKKIADLNAGSCTNMSGGLVQGLKWVNEMDLPENVVLRVILFTDGLANVGVTGRDLVEFAKEHKGRATISAFGLGSDCDQELLADIANVGGGNYSFVDSPDAALTAFARELGGLMSTYGQDLSVKITPDKNNEVLEVLNDEDVTEDKGIIIVQIRDILGEEKKWIVAKVKLNEVEKAFPRKVNAFRINVSYKDKEGEIQELDKLAVKVKFCKPGDEPKEEDKEVIQHRDNLLAARAQDEAEAHARAGNWTMAKMAIDNCCFNLSDQGTKDVLQEISVNYSCAGNYGASRGVTNSVRSAFKKKRMSYVSEDAEVLCSTAGAQSFTAMDEMADSFTADDQTVDDQSSGNVTVNSADAQPNVDVSQVYVDPTTDNKEEEKKSKVKKRSGRDW